MATKASGSRTQVAYAAETVYGTTDVAPQMIILPKSSVSLDLQKELLTNDTIVGDRMTLADRHGNRTVSGDLVAPLQHGQWDDWLQAVLGGTWTANAVKNGVTNRSYTVEVGQLDLTTPQYRRFTGVRINSFGLEVDPGSIVNVTWGLMGAGMTSSTAALDATMTAVQDKQAMSHIGGSITVDGGAVCATAFSLNIDNGMTAAFCIGSAAAEDQVWSETQVDGSVTFYFESLTQYNLFINENIVPIVVVLSDGTNTLTFTIPKAKFNTAAVPTSNSGMMFLTMDWKASRDSVTTSLMSITRSA